MDRKSKYKTLFVDIKLLGLNISSRLTSPEYLLQNEVAENKMLWSSEIPEAKINLTNNRDQDTNNISSWETRGIWHEPKYRLLPRLSHYQLSRLQAGVRKEEEQLIFTFHTYRNLQIPHLWAVLVTGYNLRKETGRWGKQKTSFVNRAEISSHHMYVSDKLSKYYKKYNLIYMSRFHYIKNPDVSFLVSWMCLTISSNWNEDTTNNSNNSKYLERIYRSSNRWLKKLSIRGLWPGAIMPHGRHLTMSGDIWGRF